MRRARRRDVLAALSDGVSGERRDMEAVTHGGGQENFRGGLLRTLALGRVELATNLLLAPIAGYCDLAFRTVCREWGGVGLACTDLLSPQGLLRGTATSLDLARTNDFDKPVGMQLYGSDPQIMAEGARWAVEHGATVVDINMGCPVDKVTKKDGGSKLLTDLDRAVDIAREVVRALDKCPLSVEEWARRTGGAKIHSPGPVPLTCKMRLCWSTEDYRCGRACSPLLARLLAEVGVVGVTVHGRTTEMKFSGEVQREGIARVVEEVAGRIPVIGNGDVKNGPDAAMMISKTGCDGVMIGRGALASPWIFRECAAYLEHGRLLERPSQPEQIATIRRFFDLMRQYRDDRYALFQINRRVSWFSRNLQRELPGGRLEGIKPFKEAVRNARSPECVYRAFEEFLAGGLRSAADDASAVEGVSATGE
ncbi:MAG: tRNA dihydrouridine synthase [Phycisphaerales bacterium]